MDTEVTYAKEAEKEENEEVQEEKESKKRSRQLKVVIMGVHFVLNDVVLAIDFVQIGMMLQFFNYNYV